MRRIRTRLLVAFVVVAILPAIPLSVLVRSLLERSFSPAFEAEIEGALEAGLDESRDRLRAERERFAAEVEAATAAGGSWGVVANVASVTDVVVRVPADLASRDVEELARWGKRKAAEVAADDVAAERVGEWLALARTESSDIVVLARPLPAGMTERAVRVAETVGLLRAFREERGAMLRGYVFPFLLTYAALLLLAMAVALLLAQRIAQPVEALGKAAGRVGAGDLETRVTARAPGEVGDLVGAFNRMVGDLASSRDELARLERVAAWRDLARKLAHEIKNPLTPIQLAVQQLRDHGPRAEPKFAALLDECAEIVDEEVEALRRLVKEFSEFARLPEPKPEWGDAVALLDDIERLYGDERVSWAPPAGIPDVRFDEAELKRALINLVDNGLAACRSGGAAENVELGIEAEPPLVRLRVADRGCGIPPENLRRVFEPNFSTKKEGMGLGLAIVEGIVRGHDGTIRVESEPERGTTFTIELPTGGPAAASREEGVR